MRISSSSLCLGYCLLLNAVELFERLCKRIAEAIKPIFDQYYRPSPMRKLEKQVSQQLPAFLPLYRKMSCKMTELTAKDRMAIDSDEIMAIRDERRNCKIICACLNSATKIAEACAKATAVAKSCKAEDISKVIEALRSEKTEFIKNLRALPNEISEAFGAIVNCKRMTALPKDLTNADHIYDILIDENRECDRELLATAFFERMLKLASS